MLRQILRSARLVFGDLSGTLVFAFLLALGAPILVATAAGIVVAVGGVALTLSRRKPVGPLQWLSLVLVLLSGAATLLTSDPRYVMAKPSVIAVVVGLFMLRPGWLSRYLPVEIERHIADVTWLFGFLWAGLMFLTAALNLVVVLRYPEYWLAFLATFPALSKLTLFAVQAGLSVVLARRRQASELARTSFDEAVA
jgi:intracellular septation protein